MGIEPTISLLSDSFKGKPRAALFAVTSITAKPTGRIPVGTAFPPPPPVPKARLVLARLSSAAARRPVGAVPAYNPKHKIFGPAATATYCFPLTSNVIGDAFIRTFVSNRHSIFPSRSSTASNPPVGFP